MTKIELQQSVLHYIMRTKLLTKNNNPKCIFQQIFRRFFYSTTVRYQITTVLIFFSDSVFYSSDVELLNLSNLRICEFPWWRLFISIQLVKAVNLRTFRRDFPTFLRNVPLFKKNSWPFLDRPKPLKNLTNIEHLVNFFLELLLVSTKIGTYLALVIKIETCSAFWQKFDGQP